MTTGFWRRLDVPGHDVARLNPDGPGWRLNGTAVFLADAGPGSLSYSLRCAADWSTLEGAVRGWIGEREVDWTVRRADGAWTLNGISQPGLGHCLDLDLGFTPATNLQQLRRIALPVGATAEVPVAWLDATADRLVQLVQTYSRRSETTYWYEAPTVGYRALLELAPSGFVSRYPGLWEAESA